MAIGGTIRDGCGAGFGVATGVAGRADSGTGGMMGGIAMGVGVVGATLGAFRFIPFIHSGGKGGAGSGATGGFTGDGGRVTMASGVGAV